MNWRDFTNPSAGGAELVTHEIAKRWALWGNEVTLLTSRYSACAKEELIDDVKISRVGGKYSVYLASAFKFLRKSSSFDVVVDQINSIPFLTPLYCRKPVVPFVFQMTQDVYFRELPKFFSSIAYKLEPLVLKLYEGSSTIVLSESAKTDLVSIGFPSEGIFVCPPGVDHEPFTPGGKTPYPSVLFLNRFVKYKNPDQLIMAFKEVIKVIPNCRLRMVGARNRGEIRSLTNLAHSLGVEKCVEILPYVRGSAKITSLQESWVHVLPSIREGWGISILEAAACGTPTIGLDVSGVRDAIRDMETGLIVHDRSTHSLANSIVTILQNESLRSKLSVEAAKWAGKFTWDSTAKGAMCALTSALN